MWVKCYRIIINYKSVVHIMKHRIAVVSKREVIWRSIKLHNLTSDYVTWFSCRYYYNISIRSGYLNISTIKVGKTFNTLSSLFHRLQVRLHLWS